MYISSDTNIWVDFQLIDALGLPFQLPHIYYMSSDALEDELLSPPDIGRRLQDLGLHSVEITTEELVYAMQIRGSDNQLSNYDCLALAIAKIRGYILLTGDGRLRKRAEKESVQVHGTIWVVDELRRNEVISANKYVQLLQELRRLTLFGAGVRLPIKELDKRIAKGDV